MLLLHGIGWGGGKRERIVSMLSLNQASGGGLMQLAGGAEKFMLRTE